MSYAKSRHIRCLDPLIKFKPNWTTCSVSLFRLLLAGLLSVWGRLSLSLSFSQALLARSLVQTALAHECTLVLAGSVTHNDRDEVRPGPGTSLSLSLWHCFSLCGRNVTHLLHLLWPAAVFLTLDTDGHDALATQCMPSSVASRHSLRALASRKGLKPQASSRQSACCDECSALRLCATSVIRFCWMPRGGSRTLACSHCTC